MQKDALPIVVLHCDDFAPIEKKDIIAVESGRLLAKLRGMAALVLLARRRRDRACL